MEKQFARIISFITMPDLIFPATFMVLVLNASIAQVMSAVMFIGVGGLPPLVVGAYWYLHSKEKSFDPPREARQPIYLTAVFSFAVGAVLFGTGIFANVYWANMSMIMAIFYALSYLVNKYFDKLSMHTAMYAFAVMLLMDKASPSFAIFFVFAPLIMWSRLALAKHDWLQLLWGWAVGLAVGLLTWTI